MTIENLPIMKLPGQSGTYKVVQFYGPEHPYLRFGIEPGRYSDYHESILRRFAEEIGVECITIPGNLDLPVAALPSGIDYRMGGAGMCDVDIERRIAIFGGDSIGYKIGIDLDHLQRLRSEFPEWQIE